MLQIGNDDAAVHAMSSMACGQRVACIWKLEIQTVLYVHLIYIKEH